MNESDALLLRLILYVATITTIAIGGITLSVYTSLQMSLVFNLFNILIGPLTAYILIWYLNRYHPCCYWLTTPYTTIFLSYPGFGAVFTYSVAYTIGFTGTCLTTVLLNTVWPLLVLVAKFIYEN